MRFLFRAAFWLIVMSALIPARPDHAANGGPTITDQVTRSLAMAGDAVSTWCANEPGGCLGLARSGADAMRIAAAAVAEPAALPASTPAAAGAAPSTTPAVPIPAARPAGLGRG